MLLLKMERQQGTPWDPTRKGIAIIRAVLNGNAGSFSTGLPISKKCATTLHRNCPRYRGKLSSLDLEIVFAFPSF